MAACSVLNYGARELSPISNADDQIEGKRQRDIETKEQVILTGPHWGPPDPSVGINALQLWTPHWKLIEIKNWKSPADDWIDKQKYYTSTQGILPHVLQPYVMYTITAPKNVCQKAMHAGINASRCWTPTQEINKNIKIAKGPRMNGWIDGHIILPLRKFYPVACILVRYAQL